jgi:uncharacterized membrane protein YkvA (DUF1232 family)
MRKRSPAVRSVCVVSPIQIVPNFIPVIGQMDDVLVVTPGIKYLRRFVPKVFSGSVRAAPAHFVNLKYL